MGKPHLDQAGMIAKIAPLSIRPATPKDWQSLANLVHFEARVHRHLDWRPALEWLGYDPYLVAERQGEVIAALACPPDPPAVAWIRLFAVTSDVPVRAAWDELWPVALDQFARTGRDITVATIPLHAWFRNLLEKSKFSRTHTVIVLRWNKGTSWQAPSRSSPMIRVMDHADLGLVEKVDASAFGLIWQNSLVDLEIAFRQAAIASVAVIEDEIVGYQISTATPMGGHLARLAVKPMHQGLGIGYALLVDLLSKFEQRGAQSVTVNTQQDNLFSLSLYQKAGFKRTGEEYPVYQTIVDR